MLLNYGFWVYWLSVTLWIVLSLWGGLRVVLDFVVLCCRLLARGNFVGVVGWLVGMGLLGLY